ncbi:MAG: hypothetical protein WA040_01945 [Anaerolineae bacterium]
MTHNCDTEGTLVQQTTTEHLHQHLGWRAVYAYNREDFGAGGLLGRASDQEVVLTRPLRAKLVEPNHDLADAACQDPALRLNNAKYGLETMNGEISA